MRRVVGARQQCSSGVRVLPVPLAALHVGNVPSARRGT